MNHPSEIRYARTNSGRLDGASRRRFLMRSAAGLGGVALTSLQGNDTHGESRRTKREGVEGLPHFASKARRVIQLFQAGGPSQLDLYDYKPALEKAHGQALPNSVFPGGAAGRSPAGEARFRVARSIFRFEQYGESGAWLSELMPYLSEVVDDIAFIKSMHTEAINHDPAITFLQTGFPLAGRPSLGSWVSHGLGSENENLPSYVTMLSGTGQLLYDRYWGSGFLPSQHRAVRFQSGAEPGLFVANPGGSTGQLDSETFRDPRRNPPISETVVGDFDRGTGIAPSETALRMQASVPELTDVSAEPERTFELYGEEARQPGTYAYHTLMARRLVERGTRFVQLFHRGWDTHGDLPRQLGARCRETDRATAGLLKDLKLRGLLDDTLVIWGGEFGRTVYGQGNPAPQSFGRDHHPGCFTTWMAGGGVRPGITYGKTDDFGYRIEENPVSVHDFHATVLHLLGFDHRTFTCDFHGRKYRLTDVHGRVVRELVG